MEGSIQNLMKVLNSLYQFFQIDYQPLLHHLTAPQTQFPPLQPQQGHDEACHPKYKQIYFLSILRALANWFSRNRSLFSRNGLGKYHKRHECCCQQFFHQQQNENMIIDQQIVHQFKIQQKTQIVYPSLNAKITIFVQSFICDIQDQTYISTFETQINSINQSLQKDKYSFNRQQIGAQIAHMNILNKIDNQTLFWSIPSIQLPLNIDQYSAQLIIEKSQLSNKQQQQKIFIHFRHLRDNSHFQIQIDSFNKPLSCIYEAEIDIKKIDSPSTTLGSPVNSICFTTVRNYQRPQIKIGEMKMSGNIDDYAQDQFEDICSIMPDIFQSDQDDQDDDMDDLIDFSSENQRIVKREILMFIKHEENRFKKKIDLQFHMKKLKYRVPQSQMKKILIQYCGTHLIDKKKGWCVSEEFLSPQQRVMKRNFEYQLEKQEKQKQERKKKKAPKKEKKVEKQGKTTLKVTTQQAQAMAKSLSNQIKNSKYPQNQVKKGKKKD